MNTNTTPRQTRWGRSRLFGGGSIALVAVSVGIGAVLSSGIGGLFATFGNPTKPWLAFAVLGLGAAAFAVFGLDIAPALLLSALFVLASADFAVRYLRISKAEG